VSKSDSRFTPLEGVGAEKSGSGVAAGNDDDEGGRSTISFQLGSGSMPGMALTAIRGALSGAVGGRRAGSG